MTVANIVLDDDGNIVVTYTDGSSTTIDLADTSADISMSESSDSGNIVANVATVAAMFGIFAAAVIVVRKKRSGNKED